MVQDDRRQFQRLRLAKPILALMQGHNALILDIGMTGAFLEHYGELSPPEKFTLSFRWQGTEIEFLCEVRHSMVVRTPGGDGKSVVSHTGVRFVEPSGDAIDQLQDLMATAVGRILAAQRANAAGEDHPAESILDQIGAARRTRTTGFLCYRFKDGKWWRIPTQSAKQPPDGFTIPAYEDDEEVETLCRTYESSDEDGRGLIRLVAELSVMSVRKP